MQCQEWPIRRKIVALSVLFGLFAGLSVVAPAAGNAAEPAGCELVRTAGTVTLSWDATGFSRFQLRTDEHGWITTIVAPENTITLTGQPDGLHYYLKAKIIKGNTQRIDCVSESLTVGCALVRDGSSVTLSWEADRLKRVQVRTLEDGWIQTVAAGENTVTLFDQPGGLHYVLAARTLGGDPYLAECDAPAEDRAVERVIHVSIDGLRSDHVTGALMPNLRRLRQRGASTLNARSDPAVTQTLPNHTSQLTGLPLGGDDGHGVDYNDDSGRTIHDEAGRYVPSVFDVVHDQGGHTAMFVGKRKFELIERSWSGTFGAADQTGFDNGRNKIDTYLKEDPADTIEPFLNLLSHDPDLEYAFFHIRYPDVFGHDFGWGTSEYRDAVSDSDEILGRIIDAVDANPLWAQTTAIIVVSDHGGPTNEISHKDETRRKNYKIPFVAWAPGAQPWGDLYALNAGSRLDPGPRQPGLDGVQPIRGHDVANLALDLLGYEALEGSEFNAAQNLKLR